MVLCPQVITDISKNVNGTIKDLADHLKDLEQTIKHGHKERNQNDQDVNGSLQIDYLVSNV